MPRSAFSVHLHERAAGEPRVSRLLLTALLPGLVAQDIDEFGAALSEIQREIGSMFAARQGGVFHPRAAPVVDALLELGVGAVGQSSWGPTVYGIVDGPERAADVAERLRVAVGRRRRTSASSTSIAAGRWARGRLGAGGGMKLLVSVVSAQEARRALAGGRGHHRRQGSERGGARGARAARPVRGGRSRRHGGAGQRGAG